MRRGQLWQLALVVITVNLLTAGSAAAQYVIDQNQPSGPSPMAAFSQTDLAQSFQPGVTPCSGAGILLDPGFGTTDTVTIQLWTGLPNAGGTMLAQGSALGTAGEWVDVHWMPVPVTVGQTYYLVFVGNTTLAIAGDTSNPYPYGQVYANAGYESFPSFDYAFRTWTGQAAAVPALGGAGLAVFALLLLAAGVAVLRRVA